MCERIDDGQIFALTQAHVERCCWELSCDNVTANKFHTIGILMKFDSTRNGDIKYMCEKLKCVCIKMRIGWIVRCTVYTPSAINANQFISILNFVRFIRVLFFSNYDVPEGSSSLLSLKSIE